MYRALSVCLIAVGVVCATLVTSHTLGGPSPQTMEVALRLDRTALRVVKNNGRDFLILRQPRCMYPADAVGAPVVPSRLVRVVVPRDAKFENVSVTACKTQKLTGKYELDYVRPECPPGTAPGASQPDPAIYGSASAFPAGKVEFLRSGLLRGYGVFFLRVNPIQYLPKSKELLFHSELTLKIEYSLTGNSNSPLKPRRESEVFRAMLERCVENPGDIEELAKAGLAGAGGALPWGGALAGGDVKYLIICADTYKDEFQPLADWKKQKGVPSEIVTVESIGTDYTGADTQEKIKKCIIEYVNDCGTVYVLLGGDTDTVPHRKCYLKAYSYSDKTAPCDLYYAGLDDLDWNDDGDDKCGELESDGDTIDMDPDVFVGRYSCGSAADVQAYVSKVIEYEKEAPDTGFGRELQLAGVRVWNMFGSESDAHVWSLRMYDDCIGPYWSPDVIETFDTTPGLTLTAGELKSEIDNGHSLFNMFTHGQANSWSVESGSYTSTDAGSQVNDKEGMVVYTVACNTNWFDSSCLGEAFTRNAGGGAIGYIGCCRYGWGDPGSYFGGRSFMLNRTFYVKLLGENLYHLGEAYAEHKWEHAGDSMAYNPYRWIQFGINLLGDPELPVWTDNPQSMSVVYPSEIAPGNQTIYVRTEPGAHVCLWKVVGASDEAYVYGDADEKGGYSADIDPATVGTLKLTVTKQNFRPVEVDIVVTDTPTLYVSTAVLPDSEAGKTYQATLEAGGGTQPYTWSVTAGSLPDGLTVNGASIDGTPTATGSWTFTVEVEDANHDTATREFTIAISLDVPDLQDFVSPDHDGNYTAQWTGSDAPTYYELQEATTLTQSITDDAESGTGLWDVSGFAVSSARSHSSSQSFHGGSGTDMNNTMTYAEAMLVGGLGQVSFWCWYDLDDGTSQGHDFAYFEISVNDGSTWIGVRTFAGNSGGWVQETVDLSPYAGRSIRMRFRYFTSHDEFAEGFYVDDIEVTGLSLYDWALVTSTGVKHHDITGRGLGTYYYRVRACDATDTSGWSEIKSITVEEAVLDLNDAGAHSVSPASIYVGQILSMGLDTGRSGTGPACAHKTSFYFSTDDSITAADYLVGEYSSPGFDTDVEAQAISVPFPAAVPGGIYYVGCIIDSGNDVGETDEANNTVLFAEQVTVLIKHTLAVNCLGCGSVTRDPDHPFYDPGDIVALTPVPDAGWLFDRWEGDLAGNMNPAIVFVNGDVSVTAVFTQIEYFITVNITGDGTVIVGPGKPTYHHGDVVTLMAMPDAGNVFSRWQGDLTGSGNPVKVTIDANKNVTALFGTPYTPPYENWGGCSCSLTRSRDAGPGAVAGYFLPLLLLILYAAFMRKRR